VRKLVCSSIDFQPLELAFRVILQEQERFSHIVFVVVVSLTVREVC
jgi:hypothetical protein